MRQERGDGRSVGIETPESLDQLVGRWSLRVVLVLPKVPNRTLGIDDHRRRVGDLRFRWVDQTPAHDHLEIGIGEQRECDLVLRGICRQLFNRIRADGPDLGARFREAIQVILQLTELTTAIGSPETAIEDQDLWAVLTFQRADPPIGGLEFEGRCGVPNREIGSPYHGRSCESCNRACDNTGNDGLHHLDSPQHSFAQ